MSFDPAPETCLRRNPITITHAVLDAQALSAFDRVKSDDGTNIVIELIDIYLKATPDRIEQINLARASADSVLLKRLAHTLKGSSSTLGLQRMARVCQELESVETNFTDNFDLVELLENEFVKARRALLVERNRRIF